MEVYLSKEIQIMNPTLAVIAVIKMNNGMKLSLNKFIRILLQN